MLDISKYFNEAEKSVFLAGKILKKYYFSSGSNFEGLGFQDAKFERFEVQNAPGIRDNSSETNGGNLENGTKTTNSGNTVKSEQG